MINIDGKLLEALQQSTCFGIAHDETIPECKQCDVKAQCKAKTEGVNIPTPKVKSPSTKSSEPESKKEAPKTNTKKSSSKSNSPKPPVDKKPEVKKSTTPPGNMPDFKPMGLEELQTLAKERNVEWKDYGNDNITRMRLIMVLKKSYQ